MVALVLVWIVAGGCHRRADEPIDYEDLRRDACIQSCDTYDTCDPDRFVGMEPEDCYERCMTLSPLLFEENQCGSRQIIYRQCIGRLTCEEFAQFEEGNNGDYPPDYAAPCVTEIVWAYSCSPDQPFDIDEPVPEYP